MSDEAKKRSRKWGWALLAVLLLAYPLSMDPAYRLVYQSHGRNFETVSTVYAPIWWIERHSDWAAPVIHWYMRTWVRSALNSRATP